MRLHVPNNPVRITWDLLKELSGKEPAGKRKAQDKEDGWRRPGYKISGTWTLQSKGTGEQAAIAVPPGLMKDLADLFFDFDNIAIDMEWVGPRNKDALRERYGKDYHGFRLFDIMYLNGRWLGDMPLSERWDMLVTIYELCRAKRPEAARRITLVRTWDGDWDKMFEETRKDPLLEGIVLKRSDSPLVGSSDNPYWFKVKYRDIHEPTKF
jgi:hypothetical protein